LWFAPPIPKVIFEIVGTNEGERNVPDGLPQVDITLFSGDEVQQQARVAGAPLMTLCTADATWSLAMLTASLARIMHHASRFCPSGRRTHAVDPSVWIGVRQLAVQRIGD
jgi:hypothetical protein